MIAVERALFPLSRFCIYSYSQSPPFNCFPRVDRVKWFSQRVVSVKSKSEENYSITHLLNHIVYIFVGFDKDECLI